MTKLSLTLVSLCAASIVACGATSDEHGSADQTPPSYDTFGVSVPGGGESDEGATVQAPGAAAETSATKTTLRGINLAGAEFGPSVPGLEGKDYFFPTTNQVDYYVSKGMNVIRLGFKWERLQPSARGAFDAAYLAKLDALVVYATGKGAQVILNPHNFARYYGVPVGSAAVPSSVFADLWSQLAVKYASNPKVIFNLVNEPNSMATEQWVDAANAAIAAIRSAGAVNAIHAPGNAWTGAHSWFSTGYGTPNAVAMLEIQDPIDNTVFEVHQYLDGNSGGQSDQCVSEDVGVERMKGFIGWLRANGKRGFVGELAGGRNTLCNTAVTKMLTYLEDNLDVLDGWLWWAGGPGWGDYQFTLEPKNGVERPQLALLLPYLGK